MKPFLNAQHRRLQTGSNFVNQDFQTINFVPFSSLNEIMIL